MPEPLTEETLTKAIAELPEGPVTMRVAPGPTALVARRLCSDGVGFVGAGEEFPVLAPVRNVTVIEDGFMEDNGWTLEPV